MHWHREIFEDMWNDKCMTKTIIQEHSSPQGEARQQAHRYCLTCICRVQATQPSP